MLSESKIKILNCTASKLKVPFGSMVEFVCEPCCTLYYSYHEVVL